MSERLERWRRGHASRSARLGDHQTLLAQRLDHQVGAGLPLCLVSQVARSGGSLLSQLLDGHAEVHSHPSEVTLHRLMRHPSEFDPALSPWHWLEVLRSRRLDQYFEHGYAKSHRADARRHPFLLPPSLHRDMFMALAERRAPRSYRDALDLYFQSFFNSWLDYRNLHGVGSSWVVGFQPRLATEIANVHRFFGFYPDGRLVSILREPASWFASAKEPGRRNSSRYEDIDYAFGIWERSATAMLEARQAYGDQVFLMTFEDLLGDTSRTMERLAAWLGIQFTPDLLTPTFNGMPIEANSSFTESPAGRVSTAPLENARFLSDPEREQVDSSLHPLYDRVAELARTEGPRAPS